MMMMSVKVLGCNKQLEEACAITVWLTVLLSVGEGSIFPLSFFMFVVDGATNPMIKESFYSFLCGLRSKDQMAAFFAKGQ